MARPARTQARTRAGWPAIEAAILARLQVEPSTGRIVATLALLALALYVSSLGYPLVFGDFAALTGAQLQAYARAVPSIGEAWLGNASFGWSALVFGSAWPWHRALNLVLHAAAVVAAYALFRRILVESTARTSVAPGWIAFLAAALFALHPVAVYGVAYLSARSVLLMGLFALVALWATARSLQARGRFAAAAGPLATAAALACGPNAIGIPLAMGLLAWTLPAGPRGGRRGAWIAVGISALIAIGYAVFWAISAAAATEPAAGGYGVAVAAACSRLLRYLGFWLLPFTPFMAIDMPEPPLAAALAGPGMLALAATGLLLAVLAGVLARRRTGLARAAAIALGCALALQAAEVLWPRLGAPFALTRSYAFMPCVMLVPACLVALLPARAAWALGGMALAAWLLLAADSLQSFSSHVALWDDAVRRAERTGPRPEDARIYLNRATLHRSEGHTLAALVDYDKALSLQPDFTRALRGRAQAFVDENRYGEALRDLDRLLELEPDQAIIHADRGLALMQARRFNEAGLAFDRAVARGVKEPRVFLNRALARLHFGGLGAAPAALVDIERAIALDPTYALAYYNRAMVFEQSANAGIRLRDALSPELMRAVASQNLDRACQLGHAGACERQRQKAEELMQGANEGPARVTPEALRQQGLPAR